MEASEETEDLEGCAKSSRIVSRGERDGSPGRIDGILCVTYTGESNCRVNASLSHLVGPDPNQAQKPEKRIGAWQKQHAVANWNWRFPRRKFRRQRIE